MLGLPFTANIATQYFEESRKLLEPKAVVEGVAAPQTPAVSARIEG